MRTKLVALLLLIGCLGAPAHAADASAESPTAKIVRLTRALERSPLSDNDKLVRGWVLEWLTETPDYEVTVCDLFGPLLKHDPTSNGGIYLLQQMFGNVAYQIEHPGDQDAHARQLAGIESMLRAYTAVIAEQPQSRIGYFDTLLQQQAAGTLKQYMTPIIDEKCKDDSPGQPDT